MEKLLIISCLQMRKQRLEQAKPLLHMTSCSLVGALLPHLNLTDQKPSPLGGLSLCFFGHIQLSFPVAPFWRAGGRLQFREVGSVSV